jgi:hypothetical protein
MRRTASSARRTARRVSRPGSGQPEQLPGPSGGAEHILNHWQFAYFRYYVRCAQAAAQGNRAEKLIRSLTGSGDVHFRNPHVASRQAERKIENVDIINVLLRGRAREAESENGEWRHQVWTATFTVVVSLEDDGTLLNVCTCWRNQS